MIRINKDECRQCLVCISNIGMTDSKGAIIEENGFPKIIESKCKKPSDCIDACPFGVIKKK